MSTNKVSNTENVIDSRTIIARIEELESLRDDWQSENELPDYIPTDTTTDDEIKAWSDEQMEKWSEWEDSEDGQELKALTALAKQCEGCGDWRYGETLIRDSYFQEYAEQLADDLGYMEGEKSNQWPFTCIDWEKAAGELQYDYSQVGFDGVDYWIRS